MKTKMIEITTHQFASKTEEFTVTKRKFAMKTNQGLRLFAVVCMVLCGGLVNAQQIKEEAGTSKPDASEATAAPVTQATPVPPQAVADSPVKATPVADGLATVPDSKHVGGEPDGVVQVANLVYANTKSSECFADHFLVQAEQESSISTSRRFHAVKLSSDEIYNFPLVIMTGEGAFELPDSERQNLKRFVERGGFLLASAGCSSKEWDKSFRNEMTKIFGEKRLAGIDFKHPVFHTVYDVDDFKAKHGTIQPLEGVHFEGRLGVLYSQDGLNDTAHTTGCCCCGGNEIKNCLEINVNILAYALTH